MLLSTHLIGLQFVHCPSQSSRFSVAQTLPKEKHCGHLDEFDSFLLVHPAWLVCFGVHMFPFWNHLIWHFEKDSYRHTDWSEDQMTASPVVWHCFFMTVTACWMKRCPVSVSLMITFPIYLNSYWWLLWQPSQFDKNTEAMVWYWIMGTQVGTHSRWSNCFFMQWPC